MSKETVKIELQIPKGVVDFLTDLFKLGCFQQAPKEFLEHETVCVVESIIDDLPMTWFDKDKILERYGLDKE